MSYIRIWIHAVWTTKRREKTLSKEVRLLLLKHIKDNAKDKGIFLKEINCDPEHLHVMLSLPADQSIGKVMQLLKGESSYWLNKNKLTKVKFEWQEEYFATSASESYVEKTIHLPRLLSRGRGPCIRRNLHLII